MRIIRRAAIVILAVGAGLGVWAATTPGHPTQRITTGAGSTSSTVPAGTTTCPMPAGYDPATATDAQLESWGIPPWPGPHDPSNPGYEAWLKGVSHIKYCAVPTPIQQNNKGVGPPMQQLTPVTGLSTGPSVTAP